MKAFLGDGVLLDVQIFTDTRALIQANSGGGKSWVLRRILEQTHGKVQHLVIDPEGEFSSLREKFDYVLAASHGGDTAAEPRTAALLAERLLELGVSAILDLYELKVPERVSFVRLFLEALVDAPKKLWHPALVIIDEAHTFCPQSSGPQSREVGSAAAVIDLAARGRKRGFCAILATQRLSKLHKDAAAECNNKLIGRTGLDVDVKRAADELGFGKERWREMRDLEPGEFFAFGPALSREVRKIKVGSVVTTHPKAGSRLAFVAPPPTDRIKALLPKLSDLPAEQEKKTKTEADLRTEIRSLRGQLAARPVAEKPVEKRVEVQVVKEAHVRRLEVMAARAHAAAEAIKESAASVSASLRQRTPPAPPAPRLAAPVKPAQAHIRADGNLTGTQQRILDVAQDLVLRGLTPKRESIARWIGIHPNGGRYLRDLAALRKAGLLEGCTPNAVATNPRRRGLDGLYEVIDGTKRRIVETLIEMQVPVSRDALAANLGIHPNGGRFLRNLAWLRTMEVISERAPIEVLPAAYE